MNTATLLMSWLAPLFLAPFALRAAPRLRWALPLASLPALLAALMAPADASLEIPWLLLGTQLGLDEAGRVFLLFAAVLWLVAGLQAELSMRGDPHLGRFRLLFLLAMAGNFWLILGRDLLSFYLGFSVMGLAAYGLVIHDGSASSRRAGRVYLVMTLVAELVLGAALLFVFAHTGVLAPTPEQLVGLGDWAIGLLLLGLGIKAGLVPLHSWLPLAHPAAPFVASAVLSGSMIKVALIGLIRFLPLGQESLWEWGSLLAWVGMTTVVYVIPVGLVQTNPKVVLAYSSVGKMGLMMTLLGMIMIAPALMPALLTAVVFYAAHHGLVKGALFIGVGVVRSGNAAWLTLLLAVPALVLAGAPLTTGALAKARLKPWLQELPGLWGDVIPALLVLSTVGATLLMARFVMLMRPDHSRSAHVDPWTMLPWLALVTMILVLPFMSDRPFPSITSSWPVALALVLALLAASLKPLRGVPGSIPPGDLIEPLARLARGLGRRFGGLFAGPVQRRGAGVAERLRLAAGHVSSASSSMGRIERRWPVAGTMVLGIGGALLFLLWMPQG